MSYTADPRVLFAAERTLLAWQRTAIALMGFGFVVERFGLFLQLVTHQSQSGAQRGFAGSRRAAVAIGRGRGADLRASIPPSREEFGSVRGPSGLLDANRRGAERHYRTHGSGFGAAFFICSAKRRLMTRIAGAHGSRFDNIWRCVATQAPPGEPT